MQNSLKHNKPKQLQLPLTTLDYIMMRARYTAPKPIWGQRVTCSELNCSHIPAKQWLALLSTHSNTKKNKFSHKNSRKYHRNSKITNTKATNYLDEPQYSGQVEAKTAVLV